MNPKPTVRDRLARVVAFAAITSFVLAALLVPMFLPWLRPSQLPKPYLAA